MKSCSTLAPHTDAMNHVARLRKAVSLSVFCLLLGACGGDTVTPPEPLPGPQLVLDSTFGTAGQVRTDLMQYNEIYAAALQPDGKIMVAGTVSEGDATAFALVRYLPDGRVDSTFGEGGSVVTNLRPPDGVWLALPYFLRVQADGKLLVGGVRYVPDDDPYRNHSPRLVILRYTAEGELDTAFADQGFFTLETFLPGDSAASDAVLQADGELVVVGSVRTERESKALLLRLTAEGQLDPSFGTGGISYALPGENARSIVLTEAQTFIVASGDELVRVNRDGTLDDTFLFVQPDDTHEWSGAERLALQADGKILLGSSEERRYIPPEPEPLRPQTSPVPVLDVVVRRLNADGSVDSSFGNNGIAVIEVREFGVLSDLKVQPDGKLAIAGRYGFSALRLNANGGLDASYVDAFESAEVALVTPENALIIVGHDSGDEQRSFALAKFLPEATAERR